MGRLTTHVLDTANGCPGEGIQVKLFRVGEGGTLALIKEAVTNSDGRIDSPLLDGSAFKIGTYVLEFATGDYFRTHGARLPDPAFLDLVPIRFGISDADSHYHVPLLVSPFSYSTYRGS